MTTKQHTDTILMVRPNAFRKNEQTAVDNLFQSDETATADTNRLAQAEFDHMLAALREAHIRVIVVDDNGINDTPDSIFPNNVISFHSNTAILYPMYAPNRRKERQLNVIGILEKNNLHFNTLKDYSTYEAQDLYLEGTGVLIIDHQHRIIYCSLSERASHELLLVYCEENNYKPVVFEATQKINDSYYPIYHTNVLMALGTHFCVICLECIRNETQKAEVITRLKATKKTIIAISEAQMNHFAGNILEVANSEGKPYICMSEQAFKAFTTAQLEQLETFGKILHFPLYTIEKYGGGSARCMMAEIFY
ncbi:citrulline utilization hydrolase CtlX [Sphingobacterium sp. Mn56C]|uniref:citrulline utilization hydrolase CtlX n=1 Tax=Sphingobacterium sp. Mn56C TaxID=3395261 RepID=UPI003BCAF57C